MVFDNKTALKGSCYYSFTQIKVKNDVGLL